jgi:long-subunit fatty acid transport protein
MKSALTLFLFAFLALASAQAQTTGGSTGTGTGTNGNGNNNNNGNTNANQTASNRAYWQATFSNGGHYMVRLTTIVCASKQIYISDGLARVVEVNIGADTAIVARFYYLEPVGKDTPISAGQIVIDRAQDLAKTAAGKVSPSASQLQVVKNYPASTHAHTVEFVLQDEATLDSLYSSLMQAINTGKGATWNEGGGTTPTGAPTGN